MNQYGNESKVSTIYRDHGGGNAMVWGFMVANGVGKLELIQCNMDCFVYLDIKKTEVFS